MQDKIFATVFGLQLREIDYYCFGLCGKIIFGGVNDAELGPLGVCRETDCPYLDKEMNEPVGSLPEGLIYLRKLQGIPGEKPSKTRATEQADGADTHGDD